MTTEWKLVPVEPTREQLDAAKNALIFDPRVSACAYREMLAAAPVPPAGGEVEVLGYLVSCYSTQLSKAPVGTDDETVELVDRAHVTRLTAERDALQAYVGRLKAGPDHFCGGPMSINPHAEAGVPGRYLEVGAVRECIPCLVKSRHDWANKANALQSELTKARELVRKARRSIDPSCAGKDLRTELDEYLAHQSAPAAECDSCDGTGDLIDIIGEWRGYCCCPAGTELKSRPAAKREHILYRDGDSIGCIPESILDRNGQVALDMCTVCGKAEAELNGPCGGAPVAKGEPDA